MNEYEVVDVGECEKGIKTPEGKILSPQEALEELIEKDVFKSVSLFVEFLEHSKKSGKCGLCGHKLK